MRLRSPPTCAARADPGAEGERSCRAVGADRAGGVSGLDAGAWAAPSAVVAAPLRSSLQPAATAPQPGVGRSPQVNPREVRRRDVLGGLIHEYHEVAA